MVDHRQDARVAQQHFIDAAGRRVTVIGRQYIGVQQHSQARQGQGEILDQADRPGVDLGIRFAVVPGHVAQFQACLGQQGIERRVQGVANVEVLALLAQVHRPQAHGEQRAAQGFKDFCHGRSRRQLAPTLLTADPTVAGTPLITGIAQLADDGVQLPMAGTLAHDKTPYSAAGQSGRANGDHFTPGHDHV